MKNNNNDDEESNPNKGGSDGYDRLALTDAVDWMDEPSVEQHEHEQHEDGTDGLFRDGDNNNNNNNDEPERHVNSSGTATTTTCYRFWQTCLLPDDGYTLCGVPLVDGPVAVKLLKFLAVTFGGILFMYKFVRLVVRI